MLSPMNALHRKGQSENCRIPEKICDTTSLMEYSLISVCITGEEQHVPLTSLNIVKRLS